VNHVRFSLDLAKPRYWWPNGLGEQHRYSVAASVRCAGRVSKPPAFRWGLRFLELETDGLFALKVNGRRVFCKGANWIPPDTIYARASDGKYDRLVAEAAGANFNMLRVWGGGLYERDAFYENCDRRGILVWQDFTFACAPYPDHLDWFRREVALEADYQTRRLRNRASLALWSGSNENNWGFHDWWHDTTQSGALFYNDLLPAAVERNCPEIPYWNGSPYGGENSPNDSDVGDRHHWHDCMMNPEMARRITPEEYDGCSSLFVSEYGYIGACCRETIETYLGGAPYDIESDVWQHHTNTFEKNTVLAGIAKHYGVGPELTLDDYILYSGLVQGLMYSYSLDSFRFRPECHGGLFWMYNDCWGEVGWTIIDYYLRRKPSWYFVRRALAPRRLILREKRGEVRVVLANDSATPVSGTVECGRVSLDGSGLNVKPNRFTAPALSRTEIARFRRGNADPARTVWFARVPRARDIEPGLLRAADFRTLETPAPDFDVRVLEAEKGLWRVRLRSRVYAHAVHLDLAAGAVCSDNYFDMLSGESRTIDVRSPRRLTDLTVRCVTNSR
jgi:beta-mannosidase